MKTKNLLIALVLVSFTASSCSFMSSIFGGSRKRGCPGNGKNVGAERLLSDQKPPKAKKFKS
jgi:hypothetical protein